MQWVIPRGTTSPVMQLARAGESSNTVVIRRAGRPARTLPQGMLRTARGTAGLAQDCELWCADQTPSANWLAAVHHATRRNDGLTPADLKYLDSGGSGLFADFVSVGALHSHFDA